MALITLPFTVTGQQLEFSQPVIAEHAVGSIGADVVPTISATVKSMD